MTDHQVKRLLISSELLLQMFTAGSHPAYVVGEKDSIPSDARLVNVRHAWPNGTELLIASESFPEVREGEQIPMLTPACYVPNSASAN